MCPLTGDQILSIATTILTPSFTYFILRRYKSQDITRYELLKSQIQTDRETFLIRTKTLSESRFVLYNNLWSVLCDLTEIADSLWENGVTKAGLKKFIDSLNSAEQTLNKSAILIDEKDFSQMQNVISILKNYRVGKEKLHRLRDTDEQAAVEIQRQIGNNFQGLGKFKEQKNKMLREIREQIGVKN